MKKLITGFTLIFIFCMALNTNSIAQSISSAAIKEQMIADWQRAKEYTNEYLNTMPGDRYGAKAVDSTRSFAQQMLHLAAANVFLMSSATGAPPLPWASFTLENSKTAQGKDSVAYYVNSSYDFCKKAVTDLDPGKWGEKITVFGRFESTRFAFMQKTFEHQTHHRGQTTIYIRLQDIRPPQERLF